MSSKNITQNLKTIKDIKNGDEITVKATNKKGEEVTLAAKGRHDPCVVPRAVPIVDAMANLVLADHFLRQKVNQ